MSRLRLIPVVTSSLPYQHGFFPMSSHIRVGSISAFKQNTISEHFTCSFCILKAQSLWIIDLDLILAPRHQCCSCIDLIAKVMREISPIDILYNYSSNDLVPISSPNRFSDEIGLLICKWNMKSAWK